MKKSIIGISLVVVLLLSMGISSFADDIDFGAKGADEKSEFTVEDMLTYAIEDEYLARAEYEDIMNEYGDQRPFSNIIKAEEYHISLLIPLLEKYGVEVQDTSSEYIETPESISESLKVGIQAEIDNIAMYEKFLKLDIPDDIRLVFEELKSASENHLNAFERTSERSTSGGRRMNRSN